MSNLPPAYMVSWGSHKQNQITLDLREASLGYVLYTDGMRCLEYIDGMWHYKPFGCPRSEGFACLDQLTVTYLDSLVFRAQWETHE